MRLALSLALAGLLVALATAAGCTSAGGSTEYEVVVRFNESVTQADMDEVDAFLRVYDDDLEFLIQETFPPTGVARLKTDDDAFCTVVEAELGAKSYVDEVTCREREDRTPVESPDAPVSYP